MTETLPSSSDERSLKGFLCAASAFLIWGLSPVYWKTLSAVPTFEIILHRVVWSFQSRLILG
jgi:chloramphenicol-sensitive protein RarD